MAAKRLQAAATPRHATPRAAPTSRFFAAPLVGA